MSKLKNTFARMHSRPGETSGKTTKIRFFSHFVFFRGAASPFQSGKIAIRSTACTNSIHNTHLPSSQLHFNMNLFSATIRTRIV